MGLPHVVAVAILVVLCPAADAVCFNVGGKSTWRCRADPVEYITGEVHQYGRQIHPWSSRDVCLWSPTGWQYDIPVNAGVYRVELGFFELYPPARAPGKRVFRVEVEGRRSVEIDVYKMGRGIGGIFSTLIVHVTDGYLTIKLLKGPIGNPILSEIDIRNKDRSEIELRSEDVLKYNVGAGAPLGYLADPRQYITGTEHHYGRPGGDAPEKTFGWSRSGWQYDIPVKSGLYDVTLIWSETYHGGAGVGKRLFGVEVGGKTVESELDVFTAAGKKLGNVLRREYKEVESVGGFLTIRLVRGSRFYPMLSGIEIRRLEGGPVTLRQADVLKYNVGSSTPMGYLPDPQQYVWGKRRVGSYYYKREVYSTFGGSSDPKWGYELPVDNGVYDVTLLYPTNNLRNIYKAGSRKFSVEIEGKTVEREIDIFATAGGKKGTMEKREYKGAVVRDGYLTIGLVKGSAGSALLAGMEIRRVDGKLMKLRSEAAVKYNVGAGAPRGYLPDPRQYITGTEHHYGRPGGDAPEKTGGWSPRGWQYDIPVKSGLYDVTLIWSEIYPGAAAVGKRLFGVELGGKTVESELDVFAAAGKKLGNVLRREYMRVDATSGKLTIKLVKGSRENPMLSGMEIRRADNNPVRRRHLDYLAFNVGPGTPWIYAADPQQFVYGAVRWAGNPKSTVPRDTYAYGAGTWGYDFPVDAGSYSVHLSFRENHYTKAGMRKFGVEIEGTTMDSELDIFSLQGKHLAVRKSYWNIDVKDGYLSIRLVKGSRGQPMMSYMRIYKTGGGYLRLRPERSVQYNVGPGSPPGYLPDPRQYVTGTEHHYGRADSLTPGETHGGSPSGWQYDIPVPAGWYVVTLIWAETYQGANRVGSRLFGVELGGKTVESELDVFRAAGRKLGYVLSREYERVDATGGKLTIKLVKGSRQNPMLSGIKIRRATEGVRKLDSSVKFNVGSNAVPGYRADPEEYVRGREEWYGDQKGRQVQQTFGWSRYSWGYDLPVFDGAYDVTLIFAEIFFSAPGKRTFGVKIEGKTVESGLDVFAAAGGKKGAVLKRTYKGVVVKDGYLTIWLVKERYVPMLSGIEIRRG